MRSWQCSIRSRTGRKPRRRLPPPEPVMYSAAPAQDLTTAPVGDYGDSDFLRAIVGRDPERAWSVMDELMDSLKIVNERVYNSVMRKIGQL